MRISKLGLKLSVLSSLLVLAVIAAMAHRLLGASREAFLAERRVRAEAFARTSGEAMFPKVDPFALHLALDELMNERGMVYAEVLDSSGKVLSHSDPTRVGEQDDSPEGANALRAPATLLQNYRGKDGVAYLDFSVPARVRAKAVGAVRLGVTRSSLEKAVAPEKRRILLIAGLAVAAAWLGTVLLVGWLTRPLPLLAEAARDIGRGKLETRVEWKSADEIGTLARAFNEMAVANQLAFAALKEEKDKLDTIFSETRDGLILTDPGGRFLLLNPTARRFLGFGASSLTAAGGPPPGLKGAFGGFECEPPLESLVEGPDRSLAFELKRKAPKLLILAGTRERLESAGGPAGLLWVFRDATFEKREELLSRGVLSLISHKLRTPLMACMGYLELLAKEAPRLEGFHKQAFEAMLTQHQRLSSMVHKLLFFASVYSPDMLVLNRAPCGLLPIAEGALRNLQEYVAKHGARVRLDKDSLGEAPSVLVDKNRVEEAVRNLIENAIKFNPQPDKQVEVRAEEADGLVRVWVKDNGPGIPEEEHPKLFHKFHQVEEGFTGQVDGMGLGLAYVRNIAEAHGGEAGVRSAPGRGSEFFVGFPPV